MTASCVKEVIISLSTFNRFQYTTQMVELGGYSICVYRVARLMNTQHQGHPPLVFCNGLGSSFDAVLPLLTQFPDRECISFDAPGTGQSPASLVPLSMKQHSQLLLLILAELGIEQCDVVGYSWGGVLAQCLAMEDDSPIRNLILIATSAGGLTSVYSPFFAIEMWQKLASEAGDFSPTYNDCIYGQMSTLFRLWGLGSQVVAVNSHSHLTQLNEISQPTLIISGKNDMVLPTVNQKWLKQGIKNAHWQTIEGGHLIIKTHVQELSDSITRFCA